MKTPSLTLAALALMTGLSSAALAQDAPAMPSAWLNHIPAAPDVFVAIDVEAGLETASAVYGMDASWVPSASTALAPMIASQLGVQVDIAELDNLIVAAWTAEMGVVMLADADAMTAPPADGVAPVAFGATPLQVARRGDLLVIGMGRPFNDALVAQTTATSGASLWAEGWASAVDDPLFVGYTSSADMLRGMSGGMGTAPGGMVIEQILLTANAANGVSLSIASPDDTPFRSSLGEMQAGSYTMLEELAAQIPAPVGELNGLLEAWMNLAWSMVSVERSENVTTVSLAESTCPSGSTGLLFTGGMLAFAGSSDAPGGPPSAAAGTPFRNIRVGYSDSCDGIAGEPASLPTELTYLAAETDQPAVLLLSDLGAAARRNLPTIFGMAPRALADQDLLTAVHNDFLGMGDLSGAEHDLAAFLVWDSSFDNILDDQVAIAMPQGMAGRVLEHMPPREGLRSGSLGSGSAYLFAEEAAYNRITQGTVESSWDAPVALIPEGATFAMIFNGAAVQVVGSEFEPDWASARDLFSASTHIVVSADTSLAPDVRWVVASGAESHAQALNTEIETFFTDMASELGPVAGLFSALPITDHLHFVAEGDTVVRLALGGAANTGLLGVWAAVGIPAFLGYRQAAAQPPAYMPPPQTTVPVGPTGPMVQPHP